MSRCEMVSKAPFLRVTGSAMEISKGQLWVPESDKVLLEKVSYLLQHLVRGVELTHNRRCT